MAEPAPVIREDISGAELAELIRREAAGRGKTLARFLAPISHNAKSWLRQVDRAGRPMPKTLDRIRRLFAGELAAPPLSAPRPAIHQVRSARAPAAPPPILARDPCPRCGIRGDIGCRHQPAWQREQLRSAAHG